MMLLLQMQLNATNYTLSKIIRWTVSEQNLYMADINKTG
jgi:hypothetical protein